MQIDYYCFTTQTGTISVYTNLDPYMYSIQMVHYQAIQREVLKALELGKLLLFDLRDNSFIDNTGKSVDISGKTIFPRCAIDESHLLLESIKKANGKSIMSINDYAVTENWFKIVKPKRELKLTTLNEIKENIEQYSQAYGSKLFVKTVKKWFSGICMIIELDFGKKAKFLLDYNFHSIELSIPDPEMSLLVCKAVNVLNDEYGKREWRAFVVGDELLCLSRSSDYIVPVEAYVESNVKKRIAECKGIMPSSYVVDFFEYAGDNGETVFDICEFNPIIASGTYQNNILVF